MANYKRIFLDGYSYFITVVTHQKNPILIENIYLLREAFRYSKEKYTYDIEAIVILPDHFHMINTPQDAREYPKIISAIKRYFTRYCDPKYFVNLEQSSSREQRGIKPVWQKRFCEHTIRNDKDMYEKLQYIYHNPVKHCYIKDATEWKYSSLNTRRVRNHAPK